MARLNSRLEKKQKLVMTDSLDKGHRKIMIAIVDLEFKRKIQGFGDRAF